MQNTCKNNKSIFKKMVHDKSFHDLIMLMLNQVVVKRAVHLTTTRLVVWLQNRKVPFLNGQGCEMCRYNSNSRL